MMRKIALLAAIAALLLLPACKGKERSKLPDKRDKVTEFATVPSFKAMFLALDKLDVTDSFQSGADFTPAAEDSLHYAFVWGTLTAASQLAIRKRDSAWLTKLTDQMVANAPKLGLQDIAAKLRSTARPMLDNKDWEGLTAVYYNMQYTVEQSLFQKRKYEVYTLLALGGWSYCTQQIAGVIEKTTRRKPPERSSNARRGAASRKTSASSASSAISHHPVSKPPTAWCATCKRSWICKPAERSIRSR